MVSKVLALLNAKDERIEELEARVAQLEEVLQFYADSANHRLDYGDVYNGTYSAVVRDGGEKARAALVEEDK